MPSDADRAVKFADGSDDLITGLGIPYGGPFNGKDLDRQFFSAKTDFAFDWFEGDRPLLYHHGLDSDAGTAVVGRVKSYEKRDAGVWVQAQLDKQSAYFSAIKELVAKGALFYSSGAMAHLVKVEPKSGEIQRWPWVELSLTPTPANLLATVDVPTADKHFKAAGLELPEAVKAPMDAESRNDLSDDDFAYVDAQGGRHLPMNDAAHARNALARFAQTTFESDAARKKAWVKLVKRCQELNIDVTQKAVSAEMLIAQLQARINRYDPFGEGAQSTVEATMPGEAYVTRKSGDDTTYWRVPYALAADGAPELGDPVEIKSDDMPEGDAPALPETSFTVQANTVRHYALTLAERTKDLGERRLKEGRVLSAASRSSLTECVGSMRSAADQLQAFLDATDPSRAKAKADLDALLVDIALLDFATAI